MTTSRSPQPPNGSTCLPPRRPATTTATTPASSPVPSARTALDELALAGIDPDLIGQYRQLLATAAEQGIEDAYRPLVAEESLSAWLDADIPQQQQLLREDRDTLLSSQAAGLLSQWSADDPDDTMVKFGAALLSLARDGLESEVFAALERSGAAQPAPERPARRG